MLFYCNSFIIYLVNISIKFMVTLILVLGILMAAMSVFAVSCSSHTDSVKNGLAATATLKVTKCCSNGNPYSYVRVRATVRPVTSTDPTTSYGYRTASQGTNSRTQTSTKTYNYSNTLVVGSAHACYARCSYCNSQFGSISSYHHS